MLSKIDKRLLSKINIQAHNKNQNVDIIVRAFDYQKTKNFLNNLYNKNSVVELPLISSLGVSVRPQDLIKIAECDSVEFLSKNSKVCSLIYQSKKVINIDYLYSKINKNYAHSCVVIDTGIYPHIDFVLGRNRIIKFVDLINNRELPYDDNGHGTFVSGVLCGNSIVDKYTGIDKNSKIIVIKALDNIGETNTIKILQAMQWILDNKDKYNIKVVCMSFGSELSSGLDPLIYGAEALWNNGIVVVSAGGNSGPEKSTIMSPGASRKIITVGSLADTKNHTNFKVADFSSRGPINNTYKPDIVVPGVDIISTNVFEQNKKFYTTMSGTSVSTPMVAGVASLLFKIKPTYTPDQIKYMLIRSCEEINGDRNSEGFGVLNLANLKLLWKIALCLRQCNFFYSGNNFIYIAFVIKVRYTNSSHSVL